MDACEKLQACLDLYGFVEISVRCLQISNILNLSKVLELASILCMFLQLSTCCIESFLMIAPLASYGFSMHAKSFAGGSCRRRE